MYNIDRFKKYNNMRKDKNLHATDLESSEKDFITDNELETISTTDDDLDIGEILISWEIPSYHKHEKPKVWYIYFFLFTALCLVYSYFNQNPLFALIVILCAILYIANEKNDPKKLIFAITEDGIVIENKFIPYKKLKAFYILYQPPLIKNVYFQPKNPIAQVITIPLGEENPVEVRKILLQYLDEDLEKEDMPGSESIGHMLKL